MTPTEIETVSKLTWAISNFFNSGEKSDRKAVFTAMLEVDKLLDDARESENNLKQKP